MRPFFEARFPGNHEHITAWREHLIATCSRFVESGLADPKFAAELTSGDDQKLWSSLSEALVAARLLHLNPVPGRKGQGPDFLIDGPNGRIWIEVICPSAGNLPRDWTEPTYGKARSVPHEAILLRWTSAIKAKAEVLLGSIDGTVPGYLASKVVLPGDAYVIAVNGCRLRGGVFSQFEGISQYPMAVEAVFPVGPMQISISRDTLEVVDRGYQLRSHILKTSGAKVPADTFLDSRFAPISAIWALDLNGESVFGNREPLAVVHNPLATVPLPKGLLPGDSEYVAEPGEDEYVLRNIKQAAAHVADDDSAATRE